MVTSLEWDDRGVVPRVDQGEVVRAHLVDTLGVLIDQGRVTDRVQTSVVVNDAEHSVVGRDAVGRAQRQVLVGGVVGPRRRDGLVAGSPEQRLDGVREADIDGTSSDRVEVLNRGSLDLLDEDIARGASHLLTLIVGDDGIVGPNVDVGHDSVLIRVQQVGSGDRGSVPDTSLGVVGINRQQLRQTTEGKVDTHFVIRQSSSRQSDTRITRVEKRQRQVEGSSRQNLTTLSIDVQRAARGVLGRRREGDGARVGQGRDVTDHVVVTVALASRDSEGRPEVKVVVVETSSNQIVEGDLALGNQVVHQVASPTENTVASGARGGVVDSGGSNSVHRQAQPSVQQVITGTRDRDRPLLTEARLTRARGQADRDLGEPSGLANLTNKVSDSVRAAIQVLFLLVISSKIDKTRGQVR